MDQGEGEPGRLRWHPLHGLRCAWSEIGIWFPCLAWNLDEGEAEVIALGHEQRADVVLLDEKEARRIARRLGLS